MKIFILIAIALLFCIPSASAQEVIVALRNKSAGAAGTWTLKNLFYFSSAGTGTGGSACANGTPNCTVTVSGISAGDKLVAASITSTNLSISSISGETWTHCSNCTAASGSTGDMAFVLSATGGDSTFVLTLSGNEPTFTAFMVWDFSYTGPSASLDKSGNTAVASCTSCAGQTLAITGANDAIVQVAVSLGLGAVSAVSSPYSLHFDNFDGLGEAAAINTSSGAAPTWTVSPADAMQQMALALVGN